MPTAAIMATTPIGNPIASPVWSSFLSTGYYACTAYHICAC